jgi:hypothetical protein
MFMAMRITKRRRLLELTRLVARRARRVTNMLTSC